MLSEREIQTLDAALERIVPPDETPGALAAGVGEYARRRAAIQPDHYRAGIALLESRGFLGLSTEAQEAVLADLEGNSAIAVIVAHALEGFYISPAGFETVGFRVTA